MTRTGSLLKNRLYQQKIRWVFIVGNNDKFQVNRMLSTIKHLGINQMDSIDFFDKNYKRVDRYTRFVNYPHTQATKLGIKDIKKILKEEEVFAVELRAG